MQSQYKKEIGVLGVFFTLGFVLGCNAVPVNAPRDSSETRPKIPEVRTFPPDSYAKDKESKGPILFSLKENTILLLKENFTGEQVGEVLKAAKKKEKLDAAAKALKGPLHDLQTKIDDYDLNLPEPPESQEARISEIDTDIQEKEKSRSELHTQNEIDELNREIESLKEEKKLRKEFIELTQKDEDLSKQLNEVSIKIGENAEPCSQPPSSLNFTFQLDGSIKVTLNNWKYREDEAPNSFSTEKNTIRNVSYQPYGGVFEFEVVILDSIKKDEPNTKAEKETYSFKILRVNYQQTDKDGRVYFSGDFVRKTNSKYCAAYKSCEPRSGVAKFNSPETKGD